MCRMGRWSFWYWFDVKRSTFDEDMNRKLFSYFHFQWPWPLTFRPQICSLITLVQRYVSTKLEVSAASLFQENRRHGTDGRTDERGATLNAAHTEGRIIIFSQSLCNSLLFERELIVSTCRGDTLVRLTLTEPFCFGISLVLDCDILAHTLFHRIACSQPLLAP